MSVNRTDVYDNDNSYTTCSTAVQRGQSQLHQRNFVHITAIPPLISIIVNNGELTADNKNRINALSRQAMHRWFTLTAFYIDALIDKSDRKLFRQASQVTVCTILSLLKHLPTVLTSFVRGNIHISFPLFNIRSLKIVISIVVYLNTYNLPYLYFTRIKYPLVKKET